MRYGINLEACNIFQRLFSKSSPTGPESYASLVNMFCSLQLFDGPIHASIKPPFHRVCPVSLGDNQVSTTESRADPHLSEAALQPS